MSLDLGGIARGAWDFVSRDPRVRDWARERLTPSTTGNYVGKKWTDRGGILGDAARTVNGVVGGVAEGSGVGVSFTNPTTGTGVAYTPGQPMSAVVPVWAILALLVIGAAFYLKRRG